MFELTCKYQFIFCQRITNSLLCPFLRVHIQLYIHSHHSPWRPFPNLTTLINRRSENMKSFEVSQSVDAAHSSLCDLTLSDYPVL